MTPVVVYLVPASIRPARDYERARRRQLVASALLVAAGLVLAGVLWVIQ